ncbi:unnamed protein product [Camellia sinensis]
MFSLSFLCTQKKKKKKKKKTNCTPNHILFILGIHPDHHFTPHTHTKKKKKKKKKKKNNNNNNTNRNSGIFLLYSAAGLFFLPPSWVSLTGAASVFPTPLGTITPPYSSTAAYGGPPNRNITVAFRFSSLFSAFSTLISAHASLYMRWSRASWEFNCCTSFVLLCSRCDKFVTAVIVSTHDFRVY